MNLRVPDPVWDRAHEAQRNQQIEAADQIYIASGVQEVFAVVGQDFIRVYADGGEWDPAQTNGTGQTDPKIDDALMMDEITAVQDRDTVIFN